MLSIGDNQNNVYENMNDTIDRCGIKWSCNNCIDQILYDNNYIFSTNTKNIFKIIN
jgi:hypothetical protein